MKLAPLFLGAALLISGCARVATTTTINADGSFSRKSVYTVGKGQGMTPPQEGQKGKDKPEDYFKIPTASVQIKVVRSENKNNLLVTASRDLAAGSPPIQDVTLLGDKGKPYAMSTVTVRKLADGNIEYVETLHGYSEVPSEKVKIPDIRMRIKKALPAEYQKTELLDQATKAISLNFAHAMFGPPEPNLLNFMTSPEAAARRVNAIAYSGNIASLKKLMPLLTDAQTQQIAKALAEIINEDTMDSPSNDDPAKSTGDLGLSPMFFAVKFPGKIVETNGIVDTLTGEVYWSLMPLVLDLGDVQLRLVISTAP